MTAPAGRPRDRVPFSANPDKTIKKILRVKPVNSLKSGIFIKFLSL
jgi:hypothetical protein